MAKNKNNGKVVKITRRSGRTMNILEFAIFGALTLYIIVIIVSYFNSEPIRGYEISMGSLSITKNYVGIALREEELISTPYTGYINFYVREGERVSTRDTAYSIDESGKLASMISGELGESSYTDADLADFRSEIIGYNHLFDKSDFQSVYDFKYDMEGMCMELVNVSMYEELESLNQSSLGGMVNMCTTGRTGYVVYNYDGYEELTSQDITADYFDQSTYELTRVNNNDLVEAGQTVGKIVTDEDWQLVIQVDEERATELEEAGYIQVKFVKTQDTSWAEVEILRQEDGIYAVLSFTNSCVTFCSDRYVEIELIINDEEGLKIPNSAIVEKDFFIIPSSYVSQGTGGTQGVYKEYFDENGNVVYEFVEINVYSETEDEYYVDDLNLNIGDYIQNQETGETMAISRSGQLTGVYNMNKGFADFKQITVLCSNDEYSIVSSNTKYGLTVYDRIVLDASSVSNEDFVY